MLAFVGGDVTDSGEDIGAVGGAPLDAVAVVDATLASLVVDIKVGEVVVEVDASGTEVPAEEGGVGGEDGGDVECSPPAQRDSDTFAASQPRSPTQVSKFDRIPVCHSWK